MIEKLGGVRFLREIRIMFLLIVFYSIRRWVNNDMGIDIVNDKSEGVLDGGCSRFRWKKWWNVKRRW
ncbi:hypothetical protein, partial [Bacillus subtilis]|uniref:hypothetical protein n=1 Tax=Bacillus subtilis TaxID=1423 RepID=UPI001BDBA50D